MKKIVVTKNLKFFEDQTERLNSLGEVIYYDNDPKTNEEWFERCKGADIICTGMYGMKSEKVYELENVLISLPYVGVEFLDREKLKERNIIVSNSPGCNKEAVAEWIAGMMLMFFRRLLEFNRVTSLPKDEILKITTSLYDKQITILGNGNIGQQLGKICESFGMKIIFFNKGDDLINSVKNADIIANCLSTNPSTIGLLDKNFFNSLKKGSLFISSSRSQVYDIEALKETLDKEILIGAIDDSASSDVGDVESIEYKNLLSHPKIFVTPHIAWNTDVEKRKANDMMIDNVEAYLKGQPINLI
jgi:phosphoglycerate dehydrogenase-like enzyme